MEKKVIEFPDVDKKLQAATKQSVFERQKHEAEQKRLRAEAETAAALKDFVKSFDDDDDDVNNNGSDGPASRSNSNAHGFSKFGASGTSGPPKRHFGASTQSTPGSGARGGYNNNGRTPTSGPGSLGPAPGSVSRKRPLDAFQAEQSRFQSDQLRRRDRDDGRLDADVLRPPSKRPAFNLSDDEDERQQGRSADPVIPKPTLQLSSLPPGTSPAVIKALMPGNLTVDGIRILPSAAATNTVERRSISAIVTLSKETPANDIEAAVNTLQNKYLGYGFYLSLHRHLSSAALSSSTAITSSTGTATQPYGAKPVHADQGPSHSHAPPAQRGFAPPTSYAPSGPGQMARNQPLLHVPVTAPRDIKELKLIHKTVELMLTHGPEFEALLMSRPQVQREEKWSWLWDPRSTGGVWYRWRLWEVLTGSQTKKGQGRYLPLFEDSSAWKAPDAPLAFEYITRMDEFVSDSEYNSSDDDDSGDEGARRRGNNRNGPPDTSNLNNDDGVSFLNPLEKAKFTHFLARLPTSTGKLRKGDIARITVFAIAHAGRGADEVVSALLSNVERPYAYTSANPDYNKKENDKSGAKDEDATPTTEEEEEDTSSAKLIALFIISDLLSSSSTSGVRHAWRFRQLFESALKQRQIFENLGRLEKKLSWGRLKAEKWKRSIGNILSLWEGWCVFPQEAQDHFVKAFNEPPLLKGDVEEAKVELIAKAAAKISKWKSVEGGTSASDGSTPTATLPISTKPDDVQMDDAEDLDGEIMADEDLDGEPMDEDDLDGEPMNDDDDEEPQDITTINSETRPELSTTQAKPALLAENPPLKRSRPRAVDMFADSGSDQD